MMTLDETPITIKNFVIDTFIIIIIVIVIIVIIVIIIIIIIIIIIAIVIVSFIIIIIKPCLNWKWTLSDMITFWGSDLSVQATAVLIRGL